MDEDDDMKPNFLTVNKDNRIIGSSPEMCSDTSSKNMTPDYEIQGLASAQNEILSTNTAGHDEEENWRSNRNEQTIDIAGTEFYDICV